MFHGIPKQSGVLGKHHKFANKTVNSKVGVQTNHIDGG